MNVRALVVALALAVAAFGDGSRPVWNPELVEAINAKTPGWRAELSPRFKGVTIDEARMLLGYVPTPEHMHVEGPSVVLRDDLPDTFDARDKWPECASIGHILDQGQCGSCWAFSATEVLSDRVCIGSGQTINVTLSPQDPVSCDTGNEGCNGGYLPKVWSYMEKHGVVEWDCLPYTSGDSGDSGTCPNKCQDPSLDWDQDKAYAASFKHITALFHREKAIRQEIYDNGPVQTGFKVYEDFMSYSSGVYSHKTGSLLGGHAVKIIGWGNEGGQDYWLVANSWSETWGLNGLFKIRRGHNECGIEGDVYAGPAKL